MERNNTFSILTYNIHKGFAFGGYRFVLPKIGDAILSLNPDLIFLQEVQGVHHGLRRRVKSWPAHSQVDYLAKKTWPYSVYSKNAVYASGHHGNAILSKFPLEGYETLNLSKVQRASRGLLHTKLKSTESSQVLHLLCVHLGLFKRERAKQLKLLIDRIAEAVPHHEPLILAGDFNDWRSHLTKPLADSLNIHEAFFKTEGAHAKSFPAIRPAFCMDRVYYRGVEITKVQCLNVKPWRTLSDHIPLWVEFTY